MYICTYVFSTAKDAWVFRDLVFEDVGFQADSLLTLKKQRCGDFTPRAYMGEGFYTSMSKPHILKHHIPEHPRWWCLCVPFS